MAIEGSLELSAISNRTARVGAKSSSEALPYEVLHNLQYQHGWTDLKLHAVDNTSSATTVVRTTSAPFTPNTTHIISGMPPRHSYIHPDFLTHLVLNQVNEVDIPIQREWVLPMAVGDTWTLRRFCGIFDSLPDRDPSTGVAGYKHQDAKRVLCAMKSHDGMGGDGTIVYYIMQEGEVKPRQN